MPENFVIATPFTVSRPASRTAAASRRPGSGASGSKWNSPSPADSASASLNLSHGARPGTRRYVHRPSRSIRSGASAPIPRPSRSYASASRGRCLVAAAGQRHRDDEQTCAGTGEPSCAGAHEIRPSVPHAYPDERAETESRHGSAQPTPLYACRPGKKMFTTAKLKITQAKPARPR